MSKNNFLEKLNTSEIESNHLLKINGKFMFNNKKIEIIHLKLFLI